MENEKTMISVLVVAPGERPKMVDIERTLEAEQAIVGGFIETFNPYKDEIAIICNEEGKISGLPLNRAIYEEPKKVELSYKEMKELFREHNRTVKNIDSIEPLFGYIVFTEDSFNTPYSEKERTYVISSDNKAYIEGMGGYSIFGNCLDGKDKNVRLDLYMTEERGPKNGWKVEKCYMLDNTNRKILDIIVGTFFICHAPHGSEQFESLPPDLAMKYSLMFRNPEHFIKIKE